MLFRPLHPAPCCARLGATGTVSPLSALQVSLFQGSGDGGQPDHLNAMHCLILVNDPAEVSRMVIELLAKKEEGQARAGEPPVGEGGGGCRPPPSDPPRRVCAVGQGPPIPLLCNIPDRLPQGCSSPVLLHPSLAPSVVVPELIVLIAI